MNDNDTEIVNQSTSHSKTAIRKSSNRKLVSWLVLLVIGMFGFGYALVPLYNVFCNLTGLNGKTGGAVAYNEAAAIDKTRWVTVEFVASKNANLPWKFYPLVKKIKIHPGENKRIAYFAENDSGHEMTVQAIPSVTPGIAAKYLKKTECFCFNQQTLKNAEAQDMPMIFHLDPALPKKISTITLSYTLFDATGFKPRSQDKSGRMG